MITEFSFTVTMVTGDRKEVELLQNSAGPVELLKETKMSDFSRETILPVCVFGLLKHTTVKSAMRVYLISQVAYGVNSVKLLSSCCGL